MKAIGLSHPIRELAGWRLITMESGSLRVTGTGITVDLNMTTGGTGIETGILIGTATGTETGTEIATSKCGVKTPGPDESNFRDRTRTMK